jgi:general secretion pathway protein K
MTLPTHLLVKRQHGAALLMAMMIVVLVATLASGMIWQQWRSVQIEQAERSRSQSAWVLSGALDWARLILREDAKKPGGADSLGEPWALPLAEARLSTFLAADKNNTDDAPEAFLSGSITDAQSRFNLLNLVSNGKVVPQQVNALRRLFSSLSIAPELALQIAEKFQLALSAPEQASESVPLLPKTLDQLIWFGIDPEVVTRMEPYVIVLPKGETRVNVNTASREVLAAVIEGLDLGTAERLMRVRQRNEFIEVTDLNKQLGRGDDSTRDVMLTTRSSFFIVQGRLRLAERTLEEKSLIERRGSDMVPLQRTRVSH